MNRACGKFPNEPHVPQAFQRYSRPVYNPIQRGNIHTLQERYNIREAPQGKIYTLIKYPSASFLQFTYSIYLLKDRREKRKCTWESHL